MHAGMHASYFFAAIGHWMTPDYKHPSAVSELSEIDGKKSKTGLFKNAYA